MCFLVSNHYILSSGFISHRKKGEFEVLEVVGRGKSPRGMGQSQSRAEPKMTKSSSDSTVFFLRLSSDKANLKWSLVGKPLNANATTMKYNNSVSAPCLKFPNVSQVQNNISNYRTDKVKQSVNVFVSSRYMALPDVDFTMCPPKNARAYKWHPSFYWDDALFKFM